MGCDIHLFVEYRRSPGGRWQSLGGEMNPGRNYGLFSRLAGVRGAGPFFPLHGFPKDASWRTQDRNELFVVDEYADDEGYVHRERAEKWVSQGLAEWCGIKPEEKTFVTCPDWHSHSWLTLAEYARCVERETGPYKAVLASMRRLEEDGSETRVVFWFDN